jgi:hypothetical protein
MGFSRQWRTSLRPVAWRRHSRGIMTNASPRAARSPRPIRTVSTSRSTAPAPGPLRAALRPALACEHGARAARSGAAPAAVEHVATRKFARSTLRALDSPGRPRANCSRTPCNCTMPCAAHKPARATLRAPDSPGRPRANCGWIRAASLDAGPASGPVCSTLRQLDSPSRTRVARPSRRCPRAPDSVCDTDANRSRWIARLTTEAGLGPSLAASQHRRGAVCLVSRVRQHGRGRSDQLRHAGRNSKRASLDFFVTRISG